MLVDGSFVLGCTADGEVAKVITASLPFVRSKPKYRARVEASKRPKTQGRKVPIGCTSAKASVVMQVLGHDYAVLF